MKKRKMPQFAMLTGGLFIAFLFAVVLYSCKKPDKMLPAQKAGTPAKQSNYQKGDFAFSVSNLRKITKPRSVYGSEGEAVIPSHLYVRFRPVTQEHITAIEEKNIPVYPYPLATDSLDVSHPDYSTLYTFLPVSKALPNCPYEILDTVMLLNPESGAAAAAFAAAGLTRRVSAGSNTVARAVNFVLEPLPCDPWVDPQPYFDSDSHNGGSRNDVLVDCFDCGCGTTPPPPPPPPPPPQPPLQPADPRPVPNTVSYNSCSMNTDVNYPSGRITVEETQWGNGGVVYEGVADIKIEILGPMGQRVVAQTNRYGCFKATNAIRGFRPLLGPRLPVIMNVIFDSDRKEIRGYNDAANLAQYTLPIRHIYANIAYRMNDASVSYERNTNDQANACKYYVAATVNNALYEFDEYAAKDGILPPPKNLKILVHRFDRSGATPMFNTMRKTHPIEYITIKAFFDATTLGLGNYFSNTPPDVAFGYKWDAAQFATDRIKETAYHEYAHASHYRKTSFQLWVDNVNFLTHNGAYGDASDPGVEKTDLIEMWGYFLGREYAHRRYGPTRHSLSAPPTFVNSWYAWNEVIRFEDEQNTNAAKIHIPSGFLHDIIDDNRYNADNGLNEVFANRLDSIHGYTVSTIYNQLNSNTKTASELIENLKWLLPTGQGNTLANYDSLKSIYRY